MSIMDLERNIEEYQLDCFMNLKHKCDDWIQAWLDMESKRQNFLTALEIKRKCIEKGALYW